MTYLLDDTAKFPISNDKGPPSLEEYTRACSDAVDEAHKEWSVAQRTRNATVSTGFIGDNRLLSILWTQSFDDLIVADDCKNNNNNDGTPKFEDLLSSLKDIFQSGDIEKHAKEWDATFAGAKLLGKLTDREDDDTLLVHWKFNAPPLTGRDMLYVVHRLKEEEPSQNSTDGKDNNTTTIDNDDSNKPNFVLRLTYAYASVSEEWVKKHCNGGKIDCTQKQRVRALNCYPSCDRITVYRDKSKMRIVLDHLMTTDIGGWVRPFCFNNLFKKKLIQANAHECEAMRDYVLSLPQKYYES